MTVRPWQKRLGRRRGLRESPLRRFVFWGWSYQLFFPFVGIERVRHVVFGVIRSTVEPTFRWSRFSELEKTFPTTKVHPSASDFNQYPRVSTTRATVPFPLLEENRALALVTSQGRMLRGQGHICSMVTGINPRLVSANAANDASDKSMIRCSRRLGPRSLTRTTTDLPRMVDTRSMD